ncbi:uncharacterized protein PV09_03194 [Verruconis gallopava]|uniref:Heterokaryon incompatibility domain-containing protein n=1 Tax=Verruconis gallopava TaxID=253628 RepID=A0A0D2AGH5_9PEZI|nr:uncharacterized protein PV09_03194 [Verruconis gallopava]KIW06013.1 hypothetical protein PV09_03194 [Verruconis gallopava]
MDELYASLPAKDPGAIRILEIQPGAFESDIILSLQSASLHDPNVYYEALSYTWGDPGDTEAIFCDGVSFRATRNLYVALRRLRENKRYRIWADALCINQSDNDEKAVQVKQMLQVYKQAKVVWMHMGAESEVEYEDKLFELMISLDRVLNRFEEQEEASVIRASDFPALGLPPLEDNSWFMWQKLLANPYFTRLWVIQEFAVSNPLYIMYGTKYFPWWNLYHISARMQKHGIGEENRAMSDPRVGLAAVQGKNGLGNLYKCHFSYHEGIPLKIGFLLWLARFVNCSEPKDKIFGILGIAGDICHEDPDFDVRYSDDESLSALFLRTARGMIRTKASHTLDLLFEGGTAHNERKKDLPSWIPDWTSRRAGSPLGGLAESAGYHAADHLELYVELEGKILRVRGKVVDRISHLSSEFRPDTQTEHDDLYYGIAVVKWLREVFDIAKAVWPGIFFNEEKREAKESLWRTLICNKTHNDGPAPAEYAGSFEHLLVRQRFVEDELGRIKDESKLMIYDETAQYRRADAKSLPYRLALQNTMYTKKFCVTKELGMMGMVPGRAEVGDCVVVIAGSPVPFIFRELALENESDSNWKLIQECYIHDVMDGKYAMVDDPKLDYMMIA